jgi:hypothetical protein
MKQKMQVPSVFGKTKRILAVSAVIALVFSSHLNAQNTSYNTNAVPIGGGDNCAFGFNALNPTGSSGNGNTAIGKEALFSNFNGNHNVANGQSALYSNLYGNNNIANGHNALYSNTHGNDNIANGQRALYSNIDGNANVASGFDALFSNISGSSNSGIGAFSDVSTGTLNNATALGSGAIVNATHKVRIGNAMVTVVEGPVPYTPSDGRFKSNIKTEDVKGLEFIQKLRPVVYNFDAKKLTELWTKNMPADVRQKYLNQDFSAASSIRQSGFIAQEVEKAAKAAGYDFNGLHVPENDGDNYSIAYAQFVVPLVKGMQEQQKMIEDQKQAIALLQQQVNDLLEKQKSTTGLDQTSTTDASMEQNVPNPFSHETIIKFNLPQQVSNAAMNVYDLSGKQLRSLPVNQRGAASITITADRLAAGMYIYSIVADGKILNSKRMVVAGK